MKLLGRELTTAELIGFVECQKEANVMDKCQCECMIFEAAGELAEIAKKQVTKAPHLWADGYSDGKLVYDMYDCPNCGRSYEIDDKYDYCPNCGQAIDWEGYEEDAETD